MRNLNAGAADYDDQLRHLTSTYTRLQQEQSRFRADLGQTPGILGRIKNALGPVAAGMLSAFSITAVVSGFMGKIREAGRIIVDFDQKQADLAAIMQKSRLQISGLTADALKYGSSTAYTSSEVSILQTELARLGKTAPEIKAMTKDVLSAATALETDLGSAATLIGGQLNSYGESADQAGKYSDIMANSVNISATSFESLNTALPKVSKVAALNGVTFERLNAILGTLADENIAAETSGTGVRNILLESAKAGKTYEEMLLQIKNSANQSKTAMDLFGKENATVAVIMANSTDKINASTKALENSAGSAEKLAKEKLNSISGSTKLFTSAWEGMLLSIEKGDGVLGKAIKSAIDFGAGLLGLVTPMKKVSNQIGEEQLGLNMLVSKITSSNTKNEERKQLLIQLKEEYPDFIKNIDIETISNGDLSKSLNDVNLQYIKRIALQQQVEEVEEKQTDVGEMTALKLKEQEKLFKVLNESKTKYNLPINIDYGDLAKSGQKIKAELQKRNVEGGMFGDIGAIDAYTTGIKVFDLAIAKSNGELNEQTQILDRQSKSFGINTEAQNEKLKAEVAAAAARTILVKQAQDLGMANAEKASIQELKMWIDAQKDKAKFQEEASEEDKKKRIKAIEDAKKHSEELLKEAEAAEKALLETKRQFQDLNNQLVSDGFDKERELINTEYNRKIEDLKKNILNEQTEIDRLNKDIKNPSNSKGDVELLKRQLKSKIELQETYNDTLFSLEQTRDLKLATLQEKYIDKTLKNQEEQNASALQKLQTQQNNELASISDLASAKAVLANYLSEEELSKIKNLDAAKLRIKELHQNDEFELQQAHLIELMALVQSVFANEEMQGITLVSDEERAKLMAYLDEAAFKLSQLGVKKAEDENAGIKGAGISALSGIDILGFSPEQWETAFASLDTFEGKIAALEIVVGALGNAFAMFFSVVDAKDQQSLNRFRSSNDKKKKALQDQLDRNYITKEQYDSRVSKLDADLERKQAEIEYKKAKRQKIMAAFEIISNTGIGILKAVSASFATGGLPWSAIIAGIGAAQLAAVLSTPLPPKGGFKGGGYTGDGSADTEAGIVHKGEFVIPQNVLFSNDPVIPNIVGYLETKRTGGNPQMNTNPTAPGSGGGGNAQLQEENKLMLKIVERATLVLEKMEEEGIPAYLVNDLKTAKRMKEKLKELNNLEANAKP
jgi:hypothetical protein